MAEALALVKRQFGPHAVILNTRSLTRGGLLGLRGGPCVEITAARQMADLPSSLRRGTVPGRPGRRDRADGVAVPVPPTCDTSASQPSEVLLSEVGALKSLVSDLAREMRSSRAANIPGQLYETYLKLVENAVAEEVAAQLIEEIRCDLTEEQLHDAKAVRARLAQSLKSMLPTSGPIRVASTGEPTIIALVGPTGVGKTTTVAKLAANLCLREHRKVGLITIDTYRIAAVEQLKTYAEIIDVPLEVAMSPEQLKQAVAHMSDRDVILTDTAGRSQRDALKIKELRGFFDAVRPHEVHLVLSSACSERVLNETIDRFREVGIDRVIFTKLDEAIGFGVILTCLQKANARLSYVTAGQDVPDDIEVGERNRIAELILGERYRGGHCGGVSHG